MPYVRSGKCPMAHLHRHRKNTARIPKFSLRERRLRENSNARAHCSGACVSSCACSEATTAGLPGACGRPAHPDPPLPYSALFRVPGLPRFLFRPVFMFPRALVAGSTPRSMASATERRNWTTLRLCAAGEERAGRWGTVGGWAKMKPGRIEPTPWGT